MGAFVWLLCERMQLANEVLNQILKRSIQQSRPDGAHMSGSGMPSAHSQFVAFFAAYAVAYTYTRCVNSLSLYSHALNHFNQLTNLLCHLAL